jgi:signal transduction histidine kinase
MGLRHRSIRLRVFLLVIIPILSLVGLYVFAAYTVVGNALELGRARIVKNTIAAPTTAFQLQLAAERGDALLYLAVPTPSTRSALTLQQAKVDKALTRWQATVASEAIVKNASPLLKGAIESLQKGASGLPALRSAVAARKITRSAVLNTYSDIAASGFQVLDGAVEQQTNVPLTVQAIAVINLDQAAQTVREESDLLVGDLTARSFSISDRREFAALAASRRVLAADNLPQLNPLLLGEYNADVSPRVANAWTAIENEVIAAKASKGTAAKPGSFTPPVSPVALKTVLTAYAAGQTKALDKATNELTGGAEVQGHRIALQLILVGGLGLLAIIVSIVFSIVIGRGLIRPLAALREAALDLANDRLPGVVERLRAGEDVDVSSEVPPLESSSDEIGQVRDAFNAVQRTAIESAVDEAMLRRGISDVFRNLARRSQSLLHRQLALLDGMERRASGPEELEDLFRIDHLTTRMRRHAEGLIILSGESPGRGWRNPVPIVDVLRAAVAEVEDYTRIRVVSRSQAALAGPAVADVIHLIAELAENATIFSPPNTPVRILGDVVGRGFAIEIEDRGLGITTEKLNEINANLASPPQFDLSGSDRLGLFIAGQLAQRHDIQITLRPSAYGGTTAIVLIPGALIVNAEAEAIESSDAAARERAIRLTGRHAALSQGGDDQFGPMRLPEPTPEDDMSRAAAELPAGENGGGHNGTGTPVPDFPADWLPANGSVPRIVESSPSPFDFPSSPAFTSEPAFPNSSDFTSEPAFPSSSDFTSEPAFPSSPAFTSEPARQDWNAPPPAAPDPGPAPAEPAELGLPRRIRQANLAPQLRKDGPPLPSGEPSPFDEPTPEAARRTMMALQQGWERGRSSAGTPVPEVMIDPEPVTGEFAIDHRNDE